MSNEASEERMVDGGCEGQDVYHQHSAAADTVWYDLRWVLEFKQSKQLLSQDLLVLIKMLAASIALFFVTRGGQLIRCEGVSYSAYERHDCRLSSGAVLEQVRAVRGSLSYGEIKKQCNPHLDLSFLDHAFTALITTNVIVFATFIGLRFAANRRWPTVYESDWLRDRSLHMSVVFFSPD